MIGFKTNLKFIVAGTARSGTVYMARVLTSLGISCGHESIFNEDEKSLIVKRIHGLIVPKLSEVSLAEEWGWVDNIIADSSYMSVPYLNMHYVKDVPVIHVVRNPLAVISSLVKDFHYFCNMQNNPFNQNGYEEWICERIPGIAEVSNSVEKACLYWIKWNKTIEECCKNRLYYFHRVEDEFRDSFFEFLGVKRKAEIYDDKKANSRKKRTKDFTLDDISDGEIKDEFISLKRRYEY